MSDSDTFFLKVTANEPWKQSAEIALPNRAMSFGDGLFETMTAIDGQIRFFELHLERLFGGMGLLGLDTKWIQKSEFLDLVKEIAPQGLVRLRWTVYRGGSGKYTPESSEPIQLLQLAEFVSAPVIKQQCGFSKQIVLPKQVWSNYKTLNSLPYVLANQERNAKNWDEILLCTPEGYISEAGSSNVFWIKGKQVFTPSLECNCLKGVVRSKLIEWFRQKNIQCSEGEFTRADLMEADQVFVSNSSGISLLAKIEDRQFSTEPLGFIPEIFS